MKGKTINGFELIRPLGVGGMAEVWYAENEIGKPAAVKMLNEDLAHNASIVERFRNEAKVLVRLDHPNIRQVYGYGSIDARPAIVMEYLDGDDLKARMKRGQHFTDEELRKWWDQIADALNYTHQQGIVHRDIKPSNIFVDKKGDIKLLDFGIAKVRESISMTQTGATMGTLMYMSPEQVDDSKHIGPTSDIYSLAVTFVHLLTGKAPYDTTNSSDFKIRESIVYKPLDMTGVPADWQAFLTPYLEKDPDKRPELQHFEFSGSGGFAIRTTGEGDLQSPSDDEGTIVADKPSTADRHCGLDPQSPTPTDKTKSKKGLWIALGIAVATVVAVALILLFALPKKGGNGNIGNANGHEWVDLGLPSGTLWATCNVGASKPEDYGNYYAWGETETKDMYYWGSGSYKYKYGFLRDVDKQVSEIELTKYCNGSKYGENGFTDNLIALQEGDDAATTNWGGGWYTPSVAQWNELLENTTNTWTTQNGVPGRLFSAKNSQTLFLPAAGFFLGRELLCIGSDGRYWSRSLYTDSPMSAWCLHFGPNDHLYLGSDDCYVYDEERRVGVSVRPVRQK